MDADGSISSSDELVGPCKRGTLRWEGVLPTGVHHNSEEGSTPSRAVRARM